MNKDSGIFRKSSLERVSSPERLNEYIKVISPSLVTILVGIFAILAAGAFWIFSANIPKYLEIQGVAVSENGIKKVYSYIDIGTAKRLSVGMNAAVSPDYAPREQFGYINAEITNIGKEIIDQNYIYEKFENPAIITPILSTGNLLEVETTLGEWSNEKGKEIEVIDGSICKVSAVIASQRAYELIFNV
jgi:hypothetical protein